jgi:hypothetical protein
MEGIAQCPTILTAINASFMMKTLIIGKLLMVLNACICAYGFSDLQNNL